jgi:4-deoxy-L-threo-5-hexosulose-uronate ketol-isomerase
MYIGAGARNVAFSSDDPVHPARFYCASTRAHRTYPTVLIPADHTRRVHLGDAAQANERTIWQYVHPEVLESAELAMGLTRLVANNVWNTMPTHTHDRRSEVYLYLDLPEDAVVFHMMGQPEETRHVVVRNEQAVISPNWSVHTGVGTSSYSLIWAMAGENQEYTDMDPVAMSDLR